MVKLQSNVCPCGITDRTRVFGTRDGGSIPPGGAATNVSGKFAP